MGVHEVGDQVQVSMDRLIFCKLRFHTIQPIYKSLESLCKLTREQQSFLQLVLPGYKKFIEIDTSRKVKTFFNTKITMTFPNATNV